MEQVLLKNDTSWRLKAIIGGSAGNLVEWYDWYAYSAFSLYFANTFFPDSNPTVQLINRLEYLQLAF
jgi:MHS family alpha-ketoglutarate permease-like MFS transporter